MLRQHKERWPQFYVLLEKYMNLHWEQKKENYIKQGFTYEMYMRWPLWPTKLEREYIEKQGGLFV